MVWVGGGLLKRIKVHPLAYKRKHTHVHKHIHTNIRKHTHTHTQAHKHTQPQGSGFRIQGSGFRVQGFFGVWGLGISATRLLKTRWGGMHKEEEGGEGEEESQSVCKCTRHPRLR